MAQTPAFSGFHIFVRDMAASAAFYRHLGFDVSEDPHHSTFSIREGVDVALGSYELTRGYRPEWEEPSGRSALALQFDLASRRAVDDLYARIVAAGYRGELAPFDAFWGARYAEVLDPDGNVVGFHSPRYPSMRSAPPPLP